MLRSCQQSCPGANTINTGIALYNNTAFIGKIPFILLTFLLPVLGHAEEEGKARLYNFPPVVPPDCSDDPTETLSSTSHKGSDVLSTGRSKDDLSSDGMVSLGTFRFHLPSTDKICGRTEEVMVYGFQHCRYTQVTEALRSDSSSFKKVYDCSIGGPYAPEAFMNTLEGKRLYQIEIPELDTENVVRELKQYCKAGLVNMVIENVKRDRQQKKLIPLLFIVDIDENPHSLTPDAVANKKYTFVTMGELRRAYKLCQDPALDPKIKAIANTTFKFTRTCEHQDKGGFYYSLQQIEPFWNTDGWAKAWQARMSVSSQKEKPEREIKKRAYWRNQLNSSLK